MIRLKDILFERIDVYSVDVIIVSDRNVNFTDIVNGVRGIRKITTVNITTPDELERKNKLRKDGKEIHTANIKFIGSKSPQEDLRFFKITMLRSDAGDPNKKIQGLQHIKYKENTLTRI